MAGGSAEEKLEYIMTVLSHTELPRPDFKTIAGETGQSNANNAQKKFKAIIESTGRKLVDNQITAASGAPPQNGKPKAKGKKAATAKPASSKKAVAPKPSPAKKRKLTPESEDDSDEHDEVVVEIKKEGAEAANVTVKEEGKTETGAEANIPAPAAPAFRGRSVTVGSSPMPTDDEGEEW